jgi:RNA polymerase sigma-70 factor (ECF subfamily)
MHEPQLTKDFLDHRQSLLGLILGLTHDVDVAEEIFQEVALVILNEAAAGKAVDGFLPWAKEIARRRVAEYYRKHSLRMRVERPTDAIADAVCLAFEENAEQPEAPWRQGHLNECLSALTERSRSLLEKRYGKKMGISDIAAAVGLTIGSVNVTLSRARKALATCIGHRMQAGEGGLA